MAEKHFSACFLLLLASGAGLSTPITSTTRKVSHYNLPTHTHPHTPIRPVKGVAPTPNATCTETTDFIFIDVLIPFLLLSFLSISLTSSITTFESVIDLIAVSSGRLNREHRAARRTQTACFTMNATTAISSTATIKATTEATADKNNLLSMIRSSWRPIQLVSLTPSSLSSTEAALGISATEILGDLAVGA